MSRLNIMLLAFLSGVALAAFLLFNNTDYLSANFRLERSQASRVRHDRFIRKYTVNAGSEGDVVTSHFRHNTFKRKEPLCGANLANLSLKPYKNPECVNCIAHSYANKESFLCHDLLPACKSINRSERSLLKCLSCAGGSHEVCASMLSGEPEYQNKQPSEIMKLIDTEGSINMVVDEIKKRFDEP